MSYMRVIARGTLNAFVQNRVPASERQVVKLAVDAWYTATSRAEWKNSADLKAQFGSASIISAERVVFNIKGNHYRLVVGIKYMRQFVFIKWLGTHAEYDRINVEEIRYDPGRYSSPPNPNRS